MDISNDYLFTSLAALVVLLTVTIVLMVKVFKNGKLKEKLAVALKKSEFELKKARKELEKQHETMVMQNREIKIREREDAEHRWYNKGLAEFSELVSRRKENIEQLCEEVIRKLVRYMEVNQGAIFLLNEEEENGEILELIAGYGLPLERMENNRFSTGEGEVGACYKESETRLISDVPQGYTSITSGLGEEVPKYLLLVPLAFDEIKLGVIEIATFKKPKHFEVEFVEKLSENIASTVSTTRASLKVNKMLVSSRKQAEEMSAHEQELEQKIEELNMLQEEASQREDELIKMAEEYESEKEGLLMKISELERNLKNGKKKTVK
jgi:GAF domain-containing protein